MTIAEKLQTIAENEPKVYNAGRTKGYNEGYADGTSGTAFETDDSIAYRKIVPSASEMYAQVLKVGGMSYKTKNFIAHPYWDKITSKNGITFTTNADNTITVKGTNDTSGAIQYVLQRDFLKAGTYTLSFGATPPDGVYGGAGFYEGTSYVLHLGYFM